jgi:hypothetical protein
MSHPCTYIFAYLSGFKKGGGVVSRGQGVCNLICRSLFYYYSDYSISLPFIFSIYFLYILPFSLYTPLLSVYSPSLYILPLPLCASLSFMYFLYILP